MLPIVGLAAAGAVASLSSPVLAQQQRLLGELVQRATYDKVLDVTESVDLLTFEAPEFFDRLQRVQTNALPRPLLVTQGLVQLLGGVAGVIGAGGGAARARTVAGPVAAGCRVADAVAGTARQRDGVRLRGRADPGACGCGSTSGGC